MCAFHLCVYVHSFNMSALIHLKYLFHEDTKLNTIEPETVLISLTEKFNCWHWPLKGDSGCNEKIEWDALIWIWQ